MKSIAILFASLLALLSTSNHVNASVMLPPNLVIREKSFPKSSAFSSRSRREAMKRGVSIYGNAQKTPLAMAIPGNGVAEQVFVGGFATFLSIYNNVITARILLSWFPQAQSIGVLQPIFTICDPYLNLFRGIIPPVFGLDLSPILAFVTLSALGNATAAVGSELPGRKALRINREGKK